MILYLLLLNIVTANKCIKIGEFSDNIIYACPIQLLNPPAPAHTSIKVYLVVEVIILNIIF